MRLFAGTRTSPAWVSGLPLFFLILAVASLSIQYLSLDVAYTAMVAASLMSAAGCFLAAFLHRSRGASGVWPPVALGAAQLLLTIQAVHLLGTGLEWANEDTTLLAASALIQAIVWSYLAQPRGRSINMAALLDTSLVAVGLVGGSLIMGPPVFAASSAASGWSLQGVVASTSLLIVVCAVAFGAFSRNPITPAYQLMLLGVVVSVMLRVYQVWILMVDVDVSDAVTATSATLISLCTAAAVAHSSFYDRGTEAAPKAWSWQRSIILLVVAAFPAGAAALSLSQGDLVDPLMVAVFLLAGVILLVLRATLAARQQDSIASEQRRMLLEDEVTGAYTRRGVLDAASWAADPLVPGGTLVRVWLDDLEDLSHTAGRDVSEAVEEAWVSRAVSLLPSEALVWRLTPGQYAVLLPGSTSAESSLRMVRTTLDPAPTLSVAKDEAVTVRTSFSAADFADFTADELDDSLALAGIAAKVERIGPAVGTQALRSRWADRTSLAQEVLADRQWGGLHVWAQPLVSLPEAKVVGYECLMRYETASRGRVMPGDFLPIADGLSLNHVLDVAVVEQACAWHGPGAPGIISVNISPQTLLDGSSLLAIAQAFADRRWHDSTVWLEVLEKDLGSMSPRLMAALSMLSGEGVRVVIDDFGAGSSSLTRLANLKASVLKLDRDLISGVGEDAHRRRIVEGMVTLSGHLGLDLLAEGVETELDARVLADLGCTLGQGFLWARPGPLASLPRIGTQLPLG